jgi:hypothetical protein
MCLASVSVLLPAAGWCADELLDTACMRRASAYVPFSRYHMYFENMQRFGYKFHLATPTLKAVNQYNMESASIGHCKSKSRFSFKFVFGYED